MHFIEAKHKEHVINILCISPLPLQSFRWLAFVQHRDEADLSIFHPAKGEARSDCKIIHKF